MIHLFTVNDLSNCIENTAIIFPRLATDNKPCCIFYANGEKYYCHFHWIDVLVYFDTEGLLK